MRHLRLILTAVAFVAFVAACSAGGSAPGSTSTLPSILAATSQAPPSATPSPPPSGSALVLQLFAIEAQPGKPSKWAPNTLSHAADEAFQIAMKVPDEDTHNLWIKDTTGKALFEGGDQVGYGTTTYDIPALTAGTYRFVCTYHVPSMTGTLTVD